jgi:hypothetical protein
MPVALPLQKMSRDEKLRAMKEGNAKFSDWKEAKKQIRRKAANLA